MQNKEIEQTAPKKQRSKKIEKATNTNMSTSRLKLGEIGSVALDIFKIITDRLAPIELRWPNLVNTFNEMEYDEAVATVLDTNYVFVEKAFTQFSVSFNKMSPKSKKASEFVSWCFNNMERQTLRQAIRDIITFKKYGFCVMEKVYTQILEGENAGGYKIKKLAYRPQETLDSTDPFKFTEDGRSIKSCVQNFSKNTLRTGFNISQVSSVLGTQVTIPRNKFMLFGHNTTEANPFGVSPLAACYKPYREKILIENYEVVGVSKDLGGTPILYLPADILNKASSDSNSQEYLSVKELTKNLANLHAGEQSFVILPSDPHDNTQMSQYSIKFLGIDGSGKMFDTDALINRRNKAIYDRFGAGFLILGNTDHGSFALSSNKQTLHSHHIERDVNHILEVINSDLIPQLLALNNIYLSDEDMPKLVAGDLTDPDIDSTSKMIQRAVSVGALPLTPEVINEMLEQSGFTYRIPDEIADNPAKLKKFMETYLPQKTSKAGAGMQRGKSGTGTANIGSEANVEGTSLNVENAP